MLTARVLREAKNLIVIGCFCIGTNQVDTQYAATHGIAVFNSPFSNSRSVAELVIGEIICLARQLGDRSNELHKGAWNKVSNGCWEIRGKTLGMLPCKRLLPQFLRLTNITRDHWLWPHRVSTIRACRCNGHDRRLFRHRKFDGAGNSQAGAHFGSTPESR